MNIVLFCLQPIRFLAEALTEESSARQLALGFALGAMIGLVPKGNLTAVALMVLLCASRVNLGAGLLSAFAFSWVGLATDPLAHQVGQRLLSAEALTPIWTTLYDTPLVPWTDFNNTVVLGSFLLGLAAFYPSYRLSRPLFARYALPLAARAQKLRVVQLLWGADLAGRLRGV